MTDHTVGGFKSNGEGWVNNNEDSATKIAKHVQFLQPAEEETYPPILPGTKVKTTEANIALKKEWTREAWEAKKWGVEGEVIGHHDSHGLCYDIRHEDGSIGCYDPTEFIVL